MKSLLILGRQPALGLAELESLYGADKVSKLNDNAALADVDPCLLAFDRLGGALKFCKVLTVLDTTNWHEIEKHLKQVAPAHSESMPSGKLLLGLSLYGFNEPIKAIHASGLSLKKAIQKTGRSVRFIPNKSAELNTAQVTHNKLTSVNGWELVFVKNGNKTVIAQTVKVQDIASYTRRDIKRPYRDLKVGTLPPKLAQIIINLASGLLPEASRQSVCDFPEGTPIPRIDYEQKLLDPFCGSGVVLQEALLMGYDVYGTDKDTRMVDYSTKNLDWLTKTFSTQITDQKYDLEIADATNYTYKPFDFIASETYLGTPFTSTPSPENLSKTMSDCNLLIKKFLQNIHAQTKTDTRLCIAVPAWQISPGKFKHLPLIDQISDLGYNLVKFEHIRNEDLIYFRPDQVVARQLLVIIRK